MTVSHNKWDRVKVIMELIVGQISKLYDRPDLDLKYLEKILAFLFTSIWLTPLLKLLS